VDGRGSAGDGTDHSHGPVPSRVALLTFMACGDTPDDHKSHDRFLAAAFGERAAGNRAGIVATGVGAPLSALRHASFSQLPIERREIHVFIQFS